MLTWNIQALINGGWKWVKIVTDTGNKHEAAEQYRKEQEAKGVKVSGFGFNHAYMVWN